jgi:hypothetical protein
VVEYGRTGLQGAGSKVIYVSTYVYVEPGQMSADFDALVAASAEVGDEIKILPNVSVYQEIGV